ncbi:hypothetical protein EJ06DRAFT_64797 [Trichodelitschia bisporula]|uniref:Uncharacterized protein n=1 Tax=Trichodelitschia bisporula TaxID=703511 RepID=A0A6G1HST8_9PEZI|nr:hypothetical protein EJ06DRAFT_64797 [Trichodelitschia bisporula]
MLSSSVSTTIQRAMPTPHHSAPSLAWSAPACAATRIRRSSLVDRPIFKQILADIDDIDVESPDENEIEEGFEAWWAEREESNDEPERVDHNSTSDGEPTLLDFDSSTDLISRAHDDHDDHGNDENNENDDVESDDDSDRSEYRLTLFGPDRGTPITPGADDDEPKFSFMDFYSDIESWLRNLDPTADPASRAGRRRLLAAIRDQLYKEYGPHKGHPLDSFAHTDPSPNACQRRDAIGYLFSRDADELRWERDLIDRDIMSEVELAERRRWEDGCRPAILAMTVGFTDRPEGPDPGACETPHSPFEQIGPDSQIREPDAEPISETGTEQGYVSRPVALRTWRKSRQI